MYRITVDRTLNNIHRSFLLYTFIYSSLFFVCLHLKKIYIVMDNCKQSEENADKADEREGNWIRQMEVAGQY